MRVHTKIVGGGGGGLPSVLMFTFLCSALNGAPEIGQRGAFSMNYYTHLLSLIKIQICVHILSCLSHIFIVMANQMAKGIVICQKTK